MRKILLLLAIVFANIASINGQTTYYSRPTATSFTDVNSWSTVTTGIGGISPASITSADIYIIQNGAALTLNANASVRRLTINAGSLTVAANTLTIEIPSANNTEFNITNGGTLNVSGGTIDVRGAVYFADGSGLNQNGGLIRVDGNSGSTATSIGGVSSASVLFGIGYSSASGSSSISTVANAAKFSLTGGTIQIVDPSLSSSTSAYALAYRGASGVHVNASTGHTVKYGDGVSTQVSGHANGFYIYLFVSTGYMSIGNVDVDVLTGTNRFVKTLSNIGIQGNLNVLSGEYWVNSVTYLGGNLTNAGTLTTTSTLRFGNWISGAAASATTTQTVSGAGTFRNLQASPTANYALVTFDNTSAGGVVFNGNKTIESTAGYSTTSSTLTFTNGVVDISAAGGVWKHGVTTNPTITWTSGGFKSGTTLKRYYTTTGTGTTIAAGTNPTFSSGSFPFVSGNPVAGMTNYQLHKSTAAITTAGFLAVTFNEGTGVNDLTPSVTDATTTLTYDKKTNANFLVALDGYVVGTANHTFAATMQNTYPATTTNTVLLVDDALVGTHQNGNATPMGQRVFAPADVFAGTMRIGAIGAELPNETVASGDWNNPSTWSSGVPVCGQNVAISIGHVVTVDATMTNENCENLTIVGTLNITGGQLTVGCTDNNSSLNNNGTLNVSGTGTLLVNGNLSNNAGSVFSQTGGDINIDGNNGDAIGASAVASGTPLLRFLANNVTLTGGKITILEPHKGNGLASTETAIQYAPTTAPYPTVTTGHTLQFGDGVSTGHGNINGFRMTLGTRLPLGNVIINTLSDSADVFSTGNTFIMGDLTITRGELQISSGNTGIIAGNIINNDTLTTIGTLNFGTYTLPSTLTPTTVAQTVSGTGVFRDVNFTTAATANFTNLTVNNTSTGGVTFSNANSVLSGTNTGTVKTTLTFTAGMISTPSGTPFTLGTTTAATGGLTYTKGGFSSGSSFKRWFGTAASGATITAAAVPAITANAGAFPFIYRVGTADSTRAFFIQQLAGATTGGTVTAQYNGVVGTSATSIVDGSYTVETLSNDNWAISQSGFVGTPTYNIAISGQAMYLASNGNTRITKASAAANGTHQNGTTLPHAQRIGLALADLNETYYIGAANIDIPITSITSGPWESPSTWSSNAVPSCSDVLVIQNAHTVTVNAAAANCKSLTVATGGTLLVTGNTLTVGCTDNNNSLILNGIMNVSAGTVNVNGRVVGTSGGNSTLIQSGGNINIDGNSGTLATSTPSHIFDFVPATAANLQLTGGTLTLVDPTATAITTDMTFKVFPSVDMIISSGSHILKFGTGVVTNNGGSATGYGINLINGSNDALIHNLVVDAPTGGLPANNRHVGSASVISINNNLTITSGEYRLANVHQINGNVTNNGVLVSTTTLTLANNSSFTTVASNNAQTIGGAGLFYNNVLPTSSTASLASLSINNANATGVTLSVPLSVSGTLTMTQGIVNTTTTNLLSLGTTTSAGTLSGSAFGALTHINGPFARTFLASRTATGTYTNTTLFPTGKAGSYLANYIDPTTTSGGHIVMRSEAFNSNSGTYVAPVTSLSTNRWEASVITNPGNFTSTHLRMDDASIGTSAKILMAPSAAGQYDAIVAPTLNAGGVINTVPAGTQITAAEFLGFISHGDLTICPAPSNQASAFVLVNKTTTTVNASITAAPSNPTGYLVVRYATGATATAPTSGVTYSAGATIGVGTVVGNFTTLTQAITGLAASTTYDFYYYAYNNPITCSGPTYNTTTPLVGTVTTCATNTTAPTVPVSSNVTPSSFDLTWGTVAGATYQLDVSTNSGFTSFLPGYNAKPLVANTEPITGLSNGTIYFARVRAIISDCISVNSTTFTDTTVGFLSVASGDWNNPTTWTGGVVPSCTDIATIASTHTVTVNSASNTVKGVTVNTGGTLVVASGDLTVGCTDNNNTFTNFGTLTVNGGILNVNGNVNIVALATFNQTGGDIIVDGNSGTTATSVLTGTNIFRINSNLLTLAGGKITIVDPHRGASTTDYSFSYNNGSDVAATSGHTVQFGNGISTDPGGHTNGNYMYLFVSSGYLSLGNVTVNVPTSANANRFVKTLSTIGMLGNLTITNGEYQLSSTTHIAGNVVNNGTLTTTSTLSFATWTGGAVSASANAQTISGTGVYRNSLTTSTANFASITINNTNVAGVTFSDSNSLLNGANTGTTSGTLTFTAGLLNTGINAFIVGTSIASVGTITHTAGGFGSGSTLTRWWAAAASGSAITTGAIPTLSSNAGAYPFATANGNRAAYLQQLAVSDGGKVSVKFTAAAGLSTVSIVDGAYTVDRRTNDAWELTNNTLTGASTYNLGISSQNNYLPLANNTRIVKAAAVANGTHQAGTTFPHGQRTGLALADLTSTYHLGIAEADIAIQAIASGNWNDPLIWNKGVVPSCTDKVLIGTGFTVAVNSAANSCDSLVLATGALLNVTSGDLTVGCADKNNTLRSSGTLNVTGGILNVNGNVVIESGSTFNQSGGDIIVDGNSGTVGTSVATGTNIFRINSNLLNLTGGKITVVDPHLGTSTSDYAFGYSTSGLHYSAGLGHTIQFGDGVSTDAGGHTNGMYIYPFVGTGYLSFGNIIINVPVSPNPNRFVKTFGTTGILGNLTVTSGDYQAASINYIAGNIINNGTITTTSTFGLGTWTNATLTPTTNVQTITGSGVWRNSATTTTANVTSFTVNNTSGTPIVLPANMISGQGTGSVSGTLTLTAGKLDVGALPLILGTSATSVGTLNPTTPTSASYIIGDMHRWMTTATGNRFFPIGTATTPRFAQINFTVAQTIGGLVTAKYNDAAPTTTGLPLAAEAGNNNIAVDLVSPTGYWTIERPIGAGGTYTAIVDATGFMGTVGIPITDVANVVLIKKPTIGDWAAGADGIATTPTNLNALTRTGCTTFSVFALGGTLVALPVTIANIRGEVTGSSNTINWTTATESNNRKFVVERSTNGNNFIAIGDVNTRALNGNSSSALQYSFVDANPLQGKVFYRLQMVDNGGRTTYSSIVTLRRGAGKLEIVDVRPNPTTGNLYFNLLGVNNNSQFTLILRTIDGKTVMVKNNFTPLGASVIDMSKLANGMYILEAVDVRNLEKAVFKVMKQ